MNERIEQDFLKEFPLLYSGLNSPRLGGSSRFQCEDGWRELLHRLSASLESILTELSPSARFKAVQVKEKFGELRFYVSEFPSYLRTEVDEVIEKAQKESLHICEECGGPGEWRSGPHRMRVRCWTCFQRQRTTT